MPLARGSWVCPESPKLRSKAQAGIGGADWPTPSKRYHQRDGFFFREQTYLPFDSYARTRYSPAFLPARASRRRFVSGGGFLTGQEPYSIGNVPEGYGAPALRRMADRTSFFLATYLSRIGLLGNPRPGHRHQFRCPAAACPFRCWSVFHAIGEL